MPDPLPPDPPFAHVLGFSARKRHYLRSFLPRTRLSPVASASALRAGDTVVAWAAAPEARALAERDDLTVLRVEDGFLRSVGLGAQLARPLSWVVDRRGIHYDPTRPSDLETLLATATFDPATLERARRLRTRIVATGLSKYNVGIGTTGGPAARRESGRPIVLVAGQVERDASLAAGAGAVRTNAALLAAARACHPDAWLIYKPHPDVVAGLRGAGRDEDDAARALCDERITDAPIAPLLDAVDAVHVMTSLTGFEALLRGRSVHCHGLPFYAGWGLTADTMQSPRRTRRLDLDTLVAAALITHPRYARRATGRPCSVEQAVDELIDWRRTDDGALRWWHRLLRPVLHHD